MEEQCGSDLATALKAVLVEIVPGTGRVPLPPLFRVNITNLLFCSVIEESVYTNTVHKEALRLKPLFTYRIFFFNMLLKWLFQKLPHLGTLTFMEILLLQVGRTPGYTKSSSGMWATACLAHGIL